MNRVKEKDKMTVVETIENVCGEVCETICKYREKAKYLEDGEEYLDRVCKTCPLDRLY